jgi:hypothetical protein
VVALSLSAAVALCRPNSPDPIPTEDALKVFAYFLPWCVLSLAVLFLTPGSFQPARRRWLKPVAVGAALTGAALILASLAMNTTDSAAGWKILKQEDRWITFSYGAEALLEGRLAEGLRWLPELAVSALYLLILINAILVAVWILKLRGARRPGSSRLFMGLAASSALLGYWLFTDIFWGWHAVSWWAVNVSTINPLLVLVVAALWLAGPIFALGLLLHALRNGNVRTALLTVQILQLPIAGFHLTLVTILLKTDLNLAGLGLLIVGSQVLTWACFALLVASEGEGRSAEAVAMTQRREA